MASRAVIRDNLTSARLEFARLLAEGHTQIESFQLAYPNSKRSSGSLRVEACRLAANPDIQAEVDRHVARNTKRNDASLDEVIKAMSEWLRFDPLSLVDEDDCIKPLKEMDPATRASIVEITVVELFEGGGEDKRKIGELKKVKLVDKRATADMFLRKFGAYIDRKVIDAEDLSHLHELLKEIQT